MHLNNYLNIIFDKKINEMPILIALNSRDHIEITI
jgi:hypothetical protein